jgi:hypothetical protein
MGEIYANYSYDRGLISITHKELKKLNQKQTIQNVLKWANDLTRHFSKEEINQALMAHACNPSYSGDR